MIAADISAQQIASVALNNRPACHAALVELSRLPKAPVGLITAAQPTY
ncbi:hypothetical protein [Methylobacterium dankookense]|nr:hypothetical protein [Methylobacterium dankookense]